MIVRCRNLDKIKIRLIPTRIETRLNIYGAITLFLLSIASNVLAEDVSISASIFSNSVHRGISLSEEEPGVSISLDKNFSNNFFVGSVISAHKGHEPIDRKGHGNIYLGYFHQLSDDKSLTYTLTDYHFKGDYFSDWDYTELAVELRLANNFSVFVSTADNYYGRETDSFYGEIAWTPKISEELFFDLALGQTINSGLQSADTINNYSAKFSYQFSRSNINVSLSFLYADKEAELIHSNNSASERLLIEISSPLY